MTAGGSLLFLDVASKLGWAEAVPGERPVFGSVSLGGKAPSSGARYGALISFLGHRFQAFRPRWVVFEAPLARNASTARITFGLCAIVEGVCDRMGVSDVREIHVATVRSKFLPKGSPKGGPELKRAVIDECRRRGFDPKSDDEADAIAGFVVASSIVVPGSADRYLPLFKGAAA